MKKTINRTRLLLYVTLSVLAVALVVIALLALAIRNQTVDVHSTEIPSSEISPPLSTTLTETAFPTSTPRISTFTQEEISQATDLDPNAFVLIIALRDGRYSHLFAYNPQIMLPVRMTNSNWDDIDPALSPDKNQLAFASHRSGYWDIYILDLATGEIVQMTNSPDYDGHPSWSNDSKWLAYETYTDGHFEINIASTVNLNEPPQLLTEDASNNHSPAWSPLGREIAFVSDRTGDQEIWMARLSEVDDRFINISLAPDSDESDPAWAANGTDLAWVTDNSGEPTITVFDELSGKSTDIGKGDLPVWQAESREIFAISNGASRTSMTVYDTAANNFTLPAFDIPAFVFGFDLMDYGTFSSFDSRLDVSNEFPPPAPWQPTYSLSTSSLNRLGVVVLPNVSAPYPYLLDAVDEAFTGLRGEVGSATGWDFLANLDSAYSPLTEPPDPGRPQNWLYTGRAIAINSLPLQAGWMVICREDHNGETYWHVYLKALKQDGSQGLPLTRSVWDLDSRYSGVPIAYEQGGQKILAPGGYWIDFTEIAMRYGWQRIAALSTWRMYYEATNFNVFVLKDSLDWHTAMGQLYPPEALATYTPLPSQTLSPGTGTRSSTSTRTPTSTATASPTVTP